MNTSFLAAYFDFYAPSVPDWVEKGSRLMEMSGTLSQRCGTVVDFRRCNHSDCLYPVVLWDSGSMSFTASDLIDVRPLEEKEQLCLPI